MPRTATRRSLWALRASSITLADTYIRPSKSVSLLEDVDAVKERHEALVEILKGIAMAGMGIWNRLVAEIWVERGFLTQRI